MNRYKWLAQYVLRMRNKEFPVFEKKYAFGIKYCLSRLSLVKEDGFLGDDYFLRIIMFPKSNEFSARQKTFRISETDYNTIMEGFK